VKLRLRTIGLFAAAVTAAAILAPTAAAHAYLERSDPADGARLGGSPGQLRLWFSEDVSSRFRVVRILDGKGRAIGPVTLSGEGRLVVADLPTLADGRYGIYWRMLSEDDGHATGGSLAFAVGDAVLPAASGGGDAQPSLSWRESVLRWFDFSFLAGLVGSLVVAALVLPRARGVGAPTVSAAAARMLRLGIWCAAVAAATGVARLAWEVVQLPSAAAAGSRLDATVDLLVSTRWGWMWLGREAALLAVVGLLVTLRRSRPRATRWRWAAVTLSVAVIAGGHALTSHAASLEPASYLAVAADALHVLSAGAWLGSVAAFAVALWPAGSLNRAHSQSLARACRTPFAECMALSVGVVLATGLYSAGREVASVDGLLTTTYGHALLVKIGIVLLAGSLGVANFLLLRALRRRGRLASRLGGSRPALLAEVVAGVGVFLAAAVLASSVPARGSEFSPPLPARVATQTATSGDLLFRVSSTPTRVGSNAFNVLVASSRRPPPAPISALSLELTRGSVARTVALSQIEPGRYVGWADLQESGRWRLLVVASRGGKTIEASLPWSLGRPDPARPVTFSTRKVAPLFDAAAALLFGATLLAAAWLLAGKPRMGLGQASTPLTGGSRGNVS
jgi:copper transport protein